MSHHSSDRDNKRRHVEQWINDVSPRATHSNNNNTRTSPTNNNNNNSNNNNNLDEEFFERQQQNEEYFMRQTPFSASQPPHMYSHSTNMNRNGPMGVFNEYYRSTNNANNHNNNNRNNMYASEGPTYNHHYQYQQSRHPMNNNNPSSNHADFHHPTMMNYPSSSSYYRHTAPATYHPSNQQHQSYFPSTQQTINSPAHQPSCSSNDHQASFYFKPRRERLNWRIMSAIDIEKLIDDVDIETLESITKNITFARIDYNDMRYFTEENFVQLFRLSQLIIEYLLYVQNYLDTKKKSMENDTQVILSDFEKCRALLAHKEEETNLLKRELKRKKKLVYAYQVVYGANPEKVKMMYQGLKSGAGAFPTTNGDQSPSIGEIQSHMKRMEMDLMTKLERQEFQNQQLLQRELSKLSESVLNKQERVLNTINTSNTKGESVRDSSIIARKVQEELGKFEQSSRTTLLRAIEEKLQAFKDTLTVEKKNLRESTEISSKLAGVERMVNQLQQKIDNQVQNISNVRSSIRVAPKKEEPSKPPQRREQSPPKPIAVTKKIVVPASSVVNNRSPQQQEQNPPKPIPVTKRIVVPASTVIREPSPQKEVVAPKTQELLAPEPEPVIYTQQLRDSIPASVHSVQNSTINDSVSESVASENSSVFEVFPGVRGNSILRTYDSSEPFKPDQQKQYLRSNFDYKTQLLDFERNEILDQLEEELRRFQIEPSADGIDESQYVRGMEMIEHAREEDNEILSLAEQLRFTLDHLAEQHFQRKKKRVSPTSKEIKSRVSEDNLPLSVPRTNLISQQERERRMRDAQLSKEAVQRLQQVKNSTPTPAPTLTKKKEDKKVSEEEKEAEEGSEEGSEYETDEGSEEEETEEYEEESDEEDLTEEEQKVNQIVVPNKISPTPVVSHFEPTREEESEEEETYEEGESEYEDEDEAEETDEEEEEEEQVKEEEKSVVTPTKIENFNESSSSKSSKDLSPKEETTMSSKPIVFLNSGRPSNSTGGVNRGIGRGNPTTLQKFADLDSDFGDIDEISL